MFSWIGRSTYRFRRAVLVAAGLFLVLALTWGTGVFGALVGGGFDDPDAESTRAQAVLTEGLGRSAADVVVLYTVDEDSQDPSVTSPTVRNGVEASLAALGPDAARVVSPYDNPAGTSTDGRRGFAVVQLAGDTDDQREAAYERLLPALADAPPGTGVELGGEVTTAVTIGEQVESDLARAEALSFPILLVLLVVVFGGLVAASLPLAVGALAVLGAFTALRGLTLVTDVSVFSLNIVTLLGLGLAIDYALFVVSRFREELRGGHDTAAALERTMATAGRTVAFSGLTVAISLAGLLVFPQVFLRSMGLGGMAAVLVAMLAALTVLPALLAVLGPRVDALQVPALRRWKQRRLTAAGSSRPWARVAEAVMRRPVAVLAVVVPALLLLGAPFLGVQWTQADASSLPAGSDARTVAETLQTDFPTDPTASITVALTGADEAAAASYADRVGALPGVTSVTANGAAGDLTRLDVSYQAAPQSDAARDLVTAIRDLPVAGPGADALVTGPTALLVDLLSGLAELLPVFLLLVGVTTLVLLFLAFGSVVLPVKALVMNVLSITAAFGALVWVFQDGNLAGLLGVTTTGSVEATQPILMLAIAFGLSMDYEVFLLSRIRERYDETGDTREAVATGLQRSGGIITAAALLLVVVIGSFATSGIVFIKMLGVGMAVAILVDATVVRALLVPALMRLMGAANWWAPAPLARLHRRIGFSESDAQAGHAGQRGVAGPDAPGSQQLAGQPAPATRRAPEPDRVRV